MSPRRSQRLQRLNRLNEDNLNQLNQSDNSNSSNIGTISVQQQNQLSNSASHQQNINTRPNNSRNKRKNDGSSKKTNTNAKSSVSKNNRLILKKTLKKATIKFNRACKQLIKLDQKISDLQNSYTNSIETDRKTFKIVYRMQLATLEGLHEAFIEYIEKKVDEIRDLKKRLFGDDEPSSNLNISGGSNEFGNDNSNQINNSLAANNPQPSN